VVLAARGEPDSVGSRFSTLMQLLVTVRPEFGRLQPAHRVALAHLTDSGRAGDTDAISAGVAELLGFVSANGPVLIVVDNIHWIDTGSVAVLASIARNLTAVRVGLLACLPGRPGASSALRMPATLKDLPWVAASIWPEKATHAPKRRHDKFGLDSLSRQQREVALLAASGLTNRAIADHMFVSHRTISAHLRQVFPKLGVATRASLRDALGDDPVTSDSVPTPADSLAGIKPRELEIAMLAATGLTNKQIAGRLYLSHRTVGANLYRIFPKLGITTRAALRDALASLLIADGRQSDDRRSTSLRDDAARDFY
jgi:DNA-binding NarL/FixJ family response regulator